MTRHTGPVTTSDRRPAGPGLDLTAWLAAAQVSDEIRALRPDYAALLITADGLRPGPSDEASEAILAAAERRATRQLAGSHPEDLPQAAQWREAFRGFGAKPQRTRPSVEALLRRVETGLPRIDRITDVYNAVSVAFLLPADGEDLARYAGPARLVRASATRTSTRSPTGSRSSTTRSPVK